MITFIKKYTIQNFSSLETPLFPNFLKSQSFKMFYKPPKTKVGLSTFFLIFYKTCANYKLLSSRNTFASKPSQTPVSYDAYQALKDKSRPNCFLQDLKH